MPSEQKLGGPDEGSGMSADLPPILTPMPIPWNKGRISGQKRPLQPTQVWAVRARLEPDGNLCDLALFPSRQHRSPYPSARQYARLWYSWIFAIGRDQSGYGTGSMRRPKAAVI